MNSLHLYSLLPVIAITIMGCSKKKTQEIIVLNPQENIISCDTIYMQERLYEEDIDWLGSKYLYKIKISPDTNLPMIEDENGKWYADNNIMLTIQREDKSIFYEHLFTKNDFEAYIPASYRESGILEGLVFDCIENQNLIFAASICRPQTDDYVPFIVALSLQKEIKITIDTRPEIED